MPKPQTAPQFSPLPEGTFDVVLADPPWNYQNWTDAKHGAADSAFETLSVEDVARLPVQDIVGDNAALCLWTPFPKLKQGLSVLESWGFDYKTALFDWTKTYREPVTLPFTPELKAALSRFIPEEDFAEFLRPSSVKNTIVIPQGGPEIPIPINKLLQVIDEKYWHYFAGNVDSVTIVPGNEYCGLGFYTRSNNEVCLLGIRGRLPRDSKGVRMSILAKRGKHSVKPMCQYDRIMELWPGKRYVELFARTCYNNQWKAWGDEAPE